MPNYFTEKFISSRSHAYMQILYLKIQVEYTHALFAKSQLLIKD
jgi:hypothetical protein